MLQLYLFVCLLSGYDLMTNSSEYRTSPSYLNIVPIHYSDPASLPLLFIFSCFKFKILFQVVLPTYAFVLLDFYQTWGDIR